MGGGGGAGRITEFLKGLKAGRYGEPALAADFKHLPYVNPDAQQGGALRMAITGSFDSLSPFIVKGTPVTGVRTYVFESLMGRNWDEPFSLYGLLAESIDVSDDARCGFRRQLANHQNGKVRA